MLNERMALETNQKFDDAFNKNDLGLMGDVWLNDPASQCIHPGWGVLSGYEPVIESWNRIFSAGQDLEIKLSHFDVTASEDLAWVSCQENLFSISMSGVQLSKVHATNLFKHVRGEWKMILHHASPVRGIPSEEKVSEN